MAIVRSKRKSNFTIISNDVFADNCLSFEAMGLLSYLLKKHDNWSVSVKQLIKVTDKTRKQSKTDSIQSILNELIEKGFVVRKRLPSGHVDYIVFDNPQNGKIPLRENPLEVESQNGKIPLRENPVNNKYGNKEITNTENTPLPPSDADKQKVIGADALVSANAKTGGGENFKNQETQSSKTEDKKAKVKTTAPVAQIMEAYNTVLGTTLPKAVELTDYRKREITARWKQLLGSTNPKGQIRYTGVDDGLIYWQRLFAKVLKNEHWCGENDRGWRADLDWFMKPRNFIKLVEFIPQGA